MDQLSGILFHMNLMDADFSSFLLRLSISTYPFRQMADTAGNLIVLRVIRIKIIFTVKFAVPV